MKHKISIITLVFLLSGMISCTNSINKKRLDADRNIEAKKYSETIKVEYNQYLEHAKTFKSEYEAMMYIDKLPLMKKTFVQTYGAEQNWDKYLAWLKKNDSHDISFTGQGVPIFKRTSHYPINFIQDKN